MFKVVVLLPAEDVADVHGEDGSDVGEDGSEHVDSGHGGPGLGVQPQSVADIVPRHHQPPVRGNHRCSAPATHHLAMTIE